MKTLLTFLFVLLAALSCVYCLRAAQARIHINTSAAASFDPTQISGLYYWLDYRTIPTGQIVTNWIPSVGSGNFSQSSSTQRPTNSISGVYFNGSSSFMSNSLGINPPTTNWSLWVVITLSSVNSYQALLMNNSVIAGFYMSSQRLLYFSGSAHYGSGTLSLATQQDLIWVNGSSLSYTNGIAYGAVIGNTSLANFNFMGNDIYSEPMKGYIKFIGIWTNNLSSVNASNLAAWSAIH